MKHQAGTTPSSTSLFTSPFLNNDFAGAMNVLFSLPTRHQPSSNDWTNVNSSPTRERRSSSGSTGSNNRRTLRVAPVVSIVECADTTEYIERRLPGCELLPKDGNEPSVGELGVEEAAESAKENGFAENGWGKVPD